MDRLIRGNLGIPRGQMPQLSGMPKEGTKAWDLPRTPLGGVDLGPMFWDRLIDLGYEVNHYTVRAIKLKATQNCLNCTKVNALAELILAGKLPPTCTFVSLDNYIIDGHHRWAATLVAGVRAGDLRWRQLLVSQIGATAREILPLAKLFEEEYGSFTA